MERRYYLEHRVLNDHKTRRDTEPPGRRLDMKLLGKEATGEETIQGTSSETLMMG